jgi:hypothetical protein
MGNVLSEEATEETFLKEGFDLESPGADKEINFGASAPRCQPKHTEEQQAADTTAAETDSSSDEVNSQAATTAEGNDKAAASQGGAESADDKESDEAGGKQKLSYIQMARMGYQELVNAIIRPPRADYKVGSASDLMSRLVVRWKGFLFIGRSPPHPFLAQPLFVVD